MAKYDAGLPPCSLVESAMPDIHREEIHARLEASEARVATSVTEMRSDLKTGLSDMQADLKTGLSDMQADLRTGLSDMRADMHQLFSAQTKWIVVIVFGALAAAGTVFSFVKPSNPVLSPQSVPFVIYAQPYPGQPPAKILPDSRP